MSILEFAKKMAARLVNIYYDDLSMEENDPNTLSDLEDVDLIDIDKHGPNDFLKNYYCCNARLPHQLTKTVSITSLSENKNHLSNNYIVCKEIKICCQILFLCRACKLPHKGDLKTAAAV